MIHLDPLQWPMKAIKNGDGWVVMQFTGLRDKKGNEIYEGDIVCCDYFSNVNPRDHDDSSYFDNRPRLGVIEWKHSEGRWHYRGESYYRMDECSKMEIVGSTYESPELVNQEA